MAKYKPIDMVKFYQDENEERDWVKVLFEVIIKILTLGFYNVEKNRKS